MTKLKPLPNELFEFYPAMSAQTHEAHVKAYAKSHLKDANTRPAAPVEGLSVMFYQVFLQGAWIDCPLSAYTLYTANGEETRKLCDYSQAEAIIAAKDRLLSASDTVAQQLQNQIVTLTLKSEDLEADNLAMDARIVELEAESSALETDNAALTARVKELEGERNSTGCADKDGNTLFVGDKVRYRQEGPHIKTEYWNPEYEIIFQAPCFTLRHIGGGKDDKSHGFILRCGGLNGSLELISRGEHGHNHETLKTQLAAAEKIAFEHGYVLACCNIVNLHDEPTIAHDALSELGVTRQAVKAMNLSEFDMKALRKIERGSAGSPYAKANRKDRAALEAKP